MELVENSGLYLGIMVVVSLAAAVAIIYLGTRKK